MQTIGKLFFQKCTTFVTHNATSNVMEADSSNVLGVG